MPDMDLTGSAELLPIEEVQKNEDSDFSRFASEAWGAIKEHPYQTAVTAAIALSARLAPAIAEIISTESLSTEKKLGQQNYKSGIERSDGRYGR